MLSQHGHAWLTVTTPSPAWWAAGEQRGRTARFSPGLSLRPEPPCRASAAHRIIRKGGKSFSTENQFYHLLLVIPRTHPPWRGALERRRPPPPVKPKHNQGVSVNCALTHGQDRSQPCLHIRSPRELLGLPWSRLHWTPRVSKSVELSIWFYLISMNWKRRF